MGISQSEFERIVNEVAQERHWNVEINGKDVYITYSTNKHTYTRHFDYNDGGEITGFTVMEFPPPYLGDIQPTLFARMVGNRIQEMLNQ